MYPYACRRWVCWTSDEFGCRKVTCTELKLSGGKIRGASSACACSLENSPHTITVSVPCDFFFFHLHQCNKLTGTNFCCCQHGIANMRAKHRAVCLLCFLWQLCSWAPRCGMRLDAGREEVSGWFLGAGWATWNTLFWSVNWASRGWDPLGLWSHVMPWLFMALICNESASPFPL